MTNISLTRKKKTKKQNNYEPSVKISISPPSGERGHYLPLQLLIPHLKCHSWAWQGKCITASTLVQGFSFQKYSVITLSEPTDVVGRCSCPHRLQEWSRSRKLYETVTKGRMRKILVFQTCKSVDSQFFKWQDFHLSFTVEDVWAKNAFFCTNVADNPSLVA